MQIKKNNNGQKIIQFDLYQALAIFTGALITTSVVTAFGIVNIANSDHFKILANEQAITEIKDDITSINLKLDRILFELK